MKKQLPFNHSLCSATSHQSAFLGILSNYEECFPWIYSNYIQIFTWKEYYNKGAHIIDFFYSIQEHFSMSEFWSCPWIRLNRIDRNDVIPHWRSFKDFIIEKINQNQYLYMTLNVGEMTSYGHNGTHNLLIYGYDDDTKIVNIADNMMDGKYSEAEISFNEIERAFPVPEDDEYLLGRPQGIMTIQKIDIQNETQTSQYSMQYRSNLRLWNKAQLKTNKIKQDLLRYLKMEIPLEYLDDSLELYGIDCMYELIHYLVFLKESKGYIDLRSISCLIDHKTIMKQRIQYLKQLGLLSKDFTDYSQICDQMLKCLNLLIKINISQKYNLIDKCIVIINAVIEEEKKILLELSREL